MKDFLIQLRTMEGGSGLTLKVENTGTKSYRVIENWFEIH